MNAQDFNNVLDETIDKIRSTLGAKAGEYADGTEDRLHNFKKAAALQEISQREALSGMMSKHTISVFDMLQSGKDYSLAQWDEKIIDHLNYLILLRAIVIEEKTSDVSTMMDPQPIEFSDVYIQTHPKANSQRKAQVPS
jgi:hypothetical protein